MGTLLSKLHIRQESVREQTGLGDLQNGFSDLPPEGIPTMQVDDDDKSLVLVNCPCTATTIAGTTVQTIASTHDAKPQEERAEHEVARAVVLSVEKPQEENAEHEDNEQPEGRRMPVNSLIESNCDQHDEFGDSVETLTIETAEPSLDNQLKEAQASRANAASDTLQSHFEDLTKLVEAEPIARKLLTKKIIHTELVEEITLLGTPVKKSQKLLLDLIRKVKARPGWFEDICHAFDEESVPGVDELRAEYKSRCGEQPKSKIPESEESTPKQSVVTQTLGTDSIMLEVEAAYRKEGVSAVQSVIEPFSTQKEVLKTILMALVNKSPELPDVVELLLATGVPAHFSLDGWTPLQCAAKNGQWRVVQLLVHECSSIEEGEALLHLAGQNGHNDVINVLLSECDPAKLGINSNDMQGNTPLHIACGRVIPDEKHVHGDNDALIQMKYEEIVSNLLMYGAKVDIQNQDGETAVHLACHCRNLQILNILLKHDSRRYINIQNKRGNTALHLACNDYNMMAALIQHRPHPHYQNMELYTPLHLACQAGNAEVAALLVQYAPGTIDGLDKDNNTAFHLASVCFNPDVVKKMILHVAPGLSIRALTKKNKNGDSPLHLACRVNNLTIVKTFLRCKGFSPCCRNKAGYTPLHIACEMGSVDIVKELVKHCPSRDIKNFLDERANANHDTAIHLACRKGYFKVVKILTKKDKDRVQVKNMDEMTPAEVAFSHGHTDICDYLGMCQNRPVYRSSSSSSVALSVSSSSTSFDTTSLSSTCTQNL